MNSFSHALAYHLCNNCTCKVVSEVCLDIGSSLWKHKSLSQYFNTNLKKPVYTFKKLLQTVEEKKYVSCELMRLPKDTKCICTQLCYPGERGANRAWQRALAAAVWGYVSKDISQGKECHPHTQHYIQEHLHVFQ